MTTLVVCAVFDQCVSAYSKPFFVQTDRAAVRSFVDEVRRQSPDNLLSVHPEDYALYKLGTYEEDTGRFSCLDVPELLARAASFAIDKELVF